MSVELKVFGGAFFPKDRALKKNPALKPLAIAINSTTKAVAEAVIYVKLATEYPDEIDSYFKVKIWEDREGIPCPELNVFSSEFFETTAVWIDKPGEPAPFPSEPENNGGDQDSAAPEMKSVKLLDQSSRAACLVLFGPVEEITAAQYGLILDLTNDDESSFNQNLAIALTKETRALALEPERRVQLLAWVREKAKESAQWPDIKKLLTKWIDTPVEKREQATSNSQETESNTKPDVNWPTDRNYQHRQMNLDNEIALGFIARDLEFDIYSTPVLIFQKAQGIELSGIHKEHQAWQLIFANTPGVLDFSRAIIIAVVKCAPEGIWEDPLKHREYITRVMVESDHANPDSLVVDIACGRSSLTLPQQEIPNDETRPLSPGEANPPANVPLNDKEFEADIARAERVRDAAEDQAGTQLAAGGGEFVPGISDPSDPKWVDGSAQPKIENIGGGVFSVDALIAQQPSNPAQTEEAPGLLTDREQSIRTLVEQVLAGKTDCFHEDEAGILLANTGHDFCHLAIMIMVDIFALENGEKPEIIDDYDVQYLAWSSLEEWSDNPETRLDVLTRVLNEYRKQEAVEQPAAVIIPPPVVTAKPVAQRPAPATETPASALTYQQQLTIAALQGLCANPAHATSFDDLPGWAVEMATDVIRQQADA